LSDFEIKYFADKVHVHRWPHDTPLWDNSTKKQLDDMINKNPQKKQIIVKGKFVQIENISFGSLKKIGISVPFFKDECTMILEGTFGIFFAHIHITTRSDNFLEIFNQLISWRKNIIK
jgi:hypothetical protein